MNNCLSVTEADKQPSAVRMSNVHFSYDGCGPEILSIEDWHVGSQKHTFVHGDSGSGKTTLLNILTGVLQPQQGIIELLGHEFSAFSARKRDAFRAKHIGIVFQEFNLIPFLNVWDNLSLAARFAGTIPKQLLHERAIQLLDRLNLPSNTLSRRADSLSVGQRQRVAIVRALVNKPALLVVDEPTSALDRKNRDEFMHILLDMGSKESSTIIFVSHDEELRQYFSYHQDMTAFVPQR